MHTCIGEWNGNPLQYSCLENPRNREAWWAATYGVTQSQTRLKWLSSSRSGKEPACQCRRRKRCLHPWVRKIPWRRAWKPTPVFLPGESPWTEEPSGLQSMGSHRVGHYWSNLAQMQGAQEWTLWNPCPKDTSFYPSSLGSKGKTSSRLNLALLKSETNLTWTTTQCHKTLSSLPSLANSLILKMALGKKK